MGFLFSTPKLPPMQPIPTQTTPAVADAGEEARKRLAAFRNKSGTILTGGLGLANDANVARKTLLGS